MKLSQTLIFFDLFNGWILISKLSEFKLFELDCFENLCQSCFVGAKAMTKMQARKSFSLPKAENSIFFTLASE